MVRIELCNRQFIFGRKRGIEMFCPKCGTNLPDTAKFCGNCGHKFEKKGEIKKKGLSPKVRKIVIAVIGMLLLVYFALLHYPELVFHHPESDFVYSVMNDGLGDVFIEISGYNGVESELIIPETLKYGWFSYDVKEVRLREHKNLTSVKIPNNATEINESAFFCCTSLISIEIPESVTRIYPDAFSYCTSLISIEIPKGVTMIENGTFYECTSLTSIEIPESVTSIDNLAFYGCTSLTSIEIPDSVTEIGGNAFNGCSSLTSITVPDGLDLSKCNIPSGCKVIRR